MSCDRCQELDKLRKEILKGLSPEAIRAGNRIAKKMEDDFADVFYGRPSKKKPKHVVNISLR